VPFEGLELGELLPEPSPGSPPGPVVTEAAVRALGRVEVAMVVVSKMVCQTTYMCFERASKVKSLGKFVILLFYFACQSC
jgi:hypothetical protein